MKHRIRIILCLICVVLMCGCSKSSEKLNIFTDAGQHHEKSTNDTRTQQIWFVDAYGEYHRAQIDPNVYPIKYDKDAFERYGNRMTYTGKGYTYRLGIDVSHYQADIDWDKVKNSGIEFAIIRLGFRGYGEEGVLKLDPKFEENIQGARAAGLDVGIYFFSQATNEEEAVEEAEYVIEHLSAYDLQLPVAYDPERISFDDARTDDVKGEQFTKNAIAFCEAIEKAGYSPMIYCNMLWQAEELDLEALEEYPIWYADYEPKPQTPYHFEYWQYSNEGKIDGIQGNVDLNIQMIES